MLLYNDRAPKITTASQASASPRANQNTTILLAVSGRCFGRLYISPIKFDEKWKENLSFSNIFRDLFLCGCGLSIWIFDFVALQMLYLDGFYLRYIGDVLALFKHNLSYTETLNKRIKEWEIARMRARNPIFFEKREYESKSVTVCDVKCVKFVWAFVETLFFS